VPFDYVLQAYAVAITSPHHTFLVLTKRIDRAAQWYEWWMREATRARYLTLQIGMALDSAPWIPKETLAKANRYYLEHCDQSDRGQFDTPVPWPIPNVHLGVTAENQKCADERIPKLLPIPAAVRYVSFEPLLGPVDLLSVPAGDIPGYAGLRLGDMLHWVIVGCESGPKRRECKLEWIADIIRQCADAGTPVFVKQIQDDHGRVVHDPKLFPRELQVREYPDASNGKT